MEPNAPRAQIKTFPAAALASAQLKHGTDSRPKVISLIRVSTAEQAGDWKSGVTRQREHNNASAARLGLDIVREVVAKDVSGRHVKLDPDFQQIFRDLKRPDIAGVIVTEQSRIFRPNAGGKGGYGDYAILDEFADNNKRIWVKDNVINPCSPEGCMALTVTGMISGEELRTLRGRILDGKVKAQKEGRCGTSWRTLPKGIRYVRERDANGKVMSERWELEPTEAAKIKRAYELLIEGLSYEQIAIKTGRTFRLGGANSMAKALQNPIWIGKRVYKYRASVEEFLSPGSTKPKRRSVLRDEDPLEVDLMDGERVGTNWIMRPSACPKLITDEMFQQAQQIIEHRRAHWRKSKLKNSTRRRPLLAGVGRCACGATLYYACSRYGYEHDRYNCSGRYEYRRPKLGTTWCGRPSASCAEVDSAVEDLVIKQLSDPAFVRRNAEHLVSATVDTKAQATNAKALKALAAQVENLKDMRQGSEITKAEYKERLGRVEDQMRELESAAPAPIPEHVTVEQIAGLFRKNFREFRLMSRDDQRDLLMRTFREVFIDTAAASPVVDLTIKPVFAEKNAGLNSVTHAAMSAGKKSSYRSPYDVRIKLAKVA